MPLWSQEMKERLHDLIVVKRLSIPEAAEEMGLGYGQVKGQKQRMGLLNRRQAGPPRRYTDEQMRRASELAAKTKGSLRWVIVAERMGAPSGDAIRMSIIRWRRSQEKQGNVS